MGVMLLSLRISNEVSIKTHAGDTITESRQISEIGLQADLMLTPDGERELQNLGVVRIQVQATPRQMPDMTPQQTLHWLREALARMLSVSAGNP